MKDQISKELFEKWLSDYTGLYVHVLPKKMTGLPKYLQSQDIVTLYIGLNMIINIPNLQVTETGWSGTLSFNRHPQFINCPFDAVPYVIGSNLDHNIILYERPLTKEVLDSMATEEPVSSGNLISVDFRNRKRK